MPVSSGDLATRTTRLCQGKDGNPLNEFPMICTSLLQDHGVMCTDKTILVTGYLRGATVMQIISRRSIALPVAVGTMAFTALCYVDIEIR
jgi:hypothetical protein